MQTALHTIYPPECLACGCLVENPFALCPACWAETPFILGASCEGCGVALPGGQASGMHLRCDGCRSAPPPWAAGRAVMEYHGIARKLVLGLKHGDRADVARASGPWLARVAGDLINPDTLILPVPLFRARLWRRRYNQSALLAQSLARARHVEVRVDGLKRIRATPSLDGKTKAERAELLQDAIIANPRQDLAGRDVMIVDDVMTSGATLRASAKAARMAGAAKVSVIVLARVGKGP